MEEILQRYVIMGKRIRMSDEELILQMNKLLRREIDSNE